MTVPPPPPFEYDPATGAYTASKRYSSPVNLLWALVFGLVVFGLAAGFELRAGFTWTSWTLIGAGVLLAAILVAVSRRSARRRPRLHEPDVPVS